MSKKISILLMVGISSLVFFGCSGNKQVKESSSAAYKINKKAQYACPMKCHISDKPGKCPVCGMKMKKIK